MKGEKINKSTFKCNVSIVIFLLLTTLLFSCENSKVKSNITTKEEQINEKQKIIKDSIREETFVKNEEKYQVVINKKLVGLSIKNKKEKDIYKKYWIDFYSTCMWQSPSYYIDDKNKFFYVFNYSEKKFKTINDEDLWETYLIDEINFSNDNLTIKVIDTVEHNVITFMFSEIENNKLYKLKTEGIEASDIIRYSFFTTEDNINKFEKEDCGDFDG